ncbi:MAG: hypothetical protein HC865_20520, partial [Cyanobacteria bacterium RU_5_0]|nr:hypothetical protein [Cyanobacteria bacterium RU_5_0]
MSALSARATTPGLPQLHAIHQLILQSVGADRWVCPLSQGNHTGIAPTHRPLHSTSNRGHYAGQLDP